MTKLTSDFSGDRSLGNEIQVFALPGEVESVTWSSKQQWR